MIYDSVTKMRPTTGPHGTSQDIVSDQETEIRLAAFERWGQLPGAHGDAVPSEAAIRAGFAFTGEHLALAGKASNIHRPARMCRGVLSIKTIEARQGRTARYDDDGDFIHTFRSARQNVHRPPVVTRVTQIRLCQFFCHPARCHPARMISKPRLIPIQAVSYTVECVKGQCVRSHPALEERKAGRGAMRDKTLGGSIMRSYLHPALLGLARYAR